MSVYPQNSITGEIIMATIKRTICDQCGEDMTGQANEEIVIKTKGRCSQGYTTVVTQDIGTKCFTQAIDAVNSVITEKAAWKVDPWAEDRG